MSLILHITMIPSLEMAVFSVHKLFGLRIGVCDVRKILPFRAVFGAPLAGVDAHDHEGRVITLEMNDFYLVTVYTPNSQDELGKNKPWHLFPGTIKRANRYRKKN